MAKLLAYTTPLRGHLYPLVPTLEELVHRGHPVAIRTLGEEVEHLESLGIGAAPVHPAIRKWETEDGTDASLAGQRREVRVLASWARIEITDFRRAIEEEHPDVLLVDGAAWGAGMVAEVSGLPWAYATPFCLPVPSRDTPPFGIGLRPRHDWVGRIRDAVVRRLIVGPVEHAFRTAINGVRSGMGLPELRNAADLFLIPPLLLSYTAEPFEFPRSDWPTSVLLVGPGLWDPVVDPPTWLCEVDDPIVLLTCSSDVQDDARLVETALEAFDGEPVSVIVTTAGLEPSRFMASPNVRIERFVPHRPILSRAVCVVCHGGMGITQKALAAGVPVCAVPFGRDQFEVARRVEVAGAGTSLPARRLRPDRLLAAVGEAIARKSGAERIARSFAAVGGPRAAADALENLLPLPPQ